MPIEASTTKNKTTSNKHKSNNQILQFIQKLNNQESKPPPIPNTHYLPKATPTPKVNPKPITTQQTTSTNTLTLTMSNDYQVNPIPSPTTPATTPTTTRTEGGGNKESVYKWRNFMEMKINQNKPKGTTTPEKNLTSTAKPTTHLKQKLPSIKKRRGVLKTGEQLKGQTKLTKFLELKSVAPNAINFQNSGENSITLYDHATDNTASI